MNTVRVQDKDYNQLLHAIPSGEHDDMWHFTGTQWHGVMICGSVALLSYIADIIANKRYCEVSFNDHRVFPDALGNAVVGDEYMSSAGWLTAHMRILKHADIAQWQGTLTEREQDNE